MFGLITKPIGCLLWFFFGGIFLLIAIACIIFFGAEFAAPVAAEKYLSTKTGFKTSVDKVDLGILSNQVVIHNAEVQNSNDFKEGTFLKINQLSVDADSLSLFKEDVIINELIVDIEQINYLRERDAESNLRAFVGQLTQLAQKKPAEETATEATTQKKRTFYIKKLTVRLNKVHYIDNDTRPAANRTFEVAYERHFNEIANLTEDFIVPLANDLSAHRLKFLVNDIVKPLASVSEFDLIKDKLNSIWQQVGGRGGEVTEEIKKLFESLND